MESSKSLQQVLGFIDSSLETLNLRGNSLGNEGVFNVMRVLEINRKLKKVILADNKFSDEDFLVDQIYRILESGLTSQRSAARAEPEVQRDPGARGAADSGRGEQGHEVLRGPHEPLQRGLQRGLLQNDEENQGQARQEEAQEKGQVEGN